MRQDKIILVGAGNVAHHLAAALLKAGANLCQIYSRTIESARELGRKTGISYTSDLSQIYPDGDIYFFCVSDDVLHPLLKSIRIHDDALLLHTSGSLPMEILKPFSKQYGVIYPVQTFSKGRDLNFKEIPLCIEGNSPVAMERIRELATDLSDNIYPVHSDQRKELHLAAVFACNFPNYLYHIAEKMLENSGLPFSVLRPLIFETAHKVMLMTPMEAQTGPAKRGDESILNGHKSMLKENKNLLKLYALLSEMIKESQTKEDNPTKQDEIADMPTLW
ncbi:MULTISPECIES: Rossmann-like and DUF2520 domain-containing protein [Sanguibacteroides]|uniref:Uncharacterized protein n=1 Tax=Sanguibacteroides justesenii TaxID=1547597 RepID=A0A0C3R6H3_9PORP|nr:MULTISPECIES: DUF2520 domain-containing protein [Sanguibacteroides]KIO43401.1 hypothetical protein IE90_09670 [Sanguibacteroides justesenii]KIO45580.1 hypothetical protein BA92_03705 [Sanguibacteroides justesenii]PXZ45325.1 DUF2520 domain-containing protein [Sanguibacteroides justesenii]